MRKLARGSRPHRALCGSVGLVAVPVTFFGIAAGKGGLLQRSMSFACQGVRGGTEHSRDTASARGNLPFVLDGRRLVFSRANSAAA